MKKEKKVWDWERVKRERSPKMYEFLKSTEGKKITEEEFITLFQAVPAREGCHNGKGTNRNPSAARHNYKGLKDFGIIK